MKKYWAIDQDWSTLKEFKTPEEALAYKEPFFQILYKKNKHSQPTVFRN